MDDLTLLWPVPQPVTLGSWSGSALCFQLRDVAGIQAIVAGLAGNPLAGRRSDLIAARQAAGGDYLADTPEGHAYGDRLRAAIEATRAWPPPFAGPEADRLLATGAGLALWLTILLGRPACGNPGFTAETAVKLLPEIADEELRHLSEVAYADHPLDFLERIADPLPAALRRPIDWHREIEAFSRRRPAYTIEAIGDLYLSQWAVLRHYDGEEDLRTAPAYQPGSVTRTRRNSRWFDQRLSRRRSLMARRAEKNGTGG